MDLSQRSNTSDSASSKKGGGGAPFNVPSSSAAQAASSLALLLREDHLLTDYNLHLSAGGKTEEVAFSYSAALLQNEEAGHVTQKATDALQEVHRKLALVESLAERVSRTSPAAVAAPLLRLHGYQLDTSSSSDDHHNNHHQHDTSNTTTTLATVRERGDRLKRQGEVLDGVARRVEMSLNRGMKRIETVTSRLSRVLSLSATLKMILRVKFESSKLDGYDLEDPRDLTRAAASVAVIEDLLSHPELSGSSSRIKAVEDIKPAIVRTASSVRAAAAKLLDNYNLSAASSTSSALLQLGTTLQVYYHLGELPQAVWNAVDHAIASVENVTSEFFCARTIHAITEGATAEAKRLAGHKADSQSQRILKKQLKEFRASAASKWATGVTDTALRVWNLHRVLCRKTDPVGRLVYVDVVALADIPDPYQRLHKGSANFNVFWLFWERMCEVLASRLHETLEQDNQRLVADAAALYPSARAASLEMMGFLQDTMQSGVGTVALEDGSASTSGILGGSAGLDDAFIGWGSSASSVKLPESTLGLDSADNWSRLETHTVSDDKVVSSASSLSLSAILQSPEWKLLEGSQQGGLFPLQKSFQEESMERLCAPLKYMFPDHVAIDENGIAESNFPLLPSKYDVQKFDEIIRQELSLADPREGGGDLSAVKMISSSICNMVKLFCKQAYNAVCEPSDSACLTADGLTTSAMTHDMKVTKILFTMTAYLRQTPEKTFIAPYRPAASPQHEEAARICQAALVPAIRDLEQMVRSILSPLIRALNRRVASTMARIHAGVYKDADPESPSFVQKHLLQVFESIADNQLAKLPPDYASTIAASVAAFSIYTFVSNVALLRPLDDSARMAVTQDLTEFELILEQFVAKCSSSLSLGKIDGGKPYAELRAVRQMLFWAGLENKEKQPTSIAKSLLREKWIKDVRPSTVCHYLFTYAPGLLSSPHHSKRMRVEDYVGTIVGLDAHTEDGEARAWMAIMACCDAYQQRESVGTTPTDGDTRVASVLMTIGPELLRPRRN